VVKFAQIERVLHINIGVDGKQFCGMIHSTEEQSSTRREQDAAVKRFETELQGLKGNRRFRRIGTETRERWATKVSGDRTMFRERRATGVSGASDEVQEAPGDRGFRSIGNGEQGAPGNRSSRQTGTAIQGQRATEVQEEP
jgi:hypothetical protein